MAFAHVGRVVFRPWLSHRCTRCLGGDESVSTTTGCRARPTSAPQVAYLAAQQPKLFRFLSAARRGASGDPSRPYGRYPDRTPSSHP